MELRNTHFQESAPWPTLPVVGSGTTAGDFVEETQVLAINLSSNI